MENQFIIVSAKEQYFDSKMDGFAVPIVAKSMARLQHFTEHILDFQFTNDHETDDVNRRRFCRDC